MEIKEARYVNKEELNKIEPAYVNWDDISKGADKVLYIRSSETSLVYSLKYIKEHGFIGTTQEVATKCVDSFMESCDEEWM